MSEARAGSPQPAQLPDSPEERVEARAHRTQAFPLGGVFGGGIGAGRAGRVLSCHCPQLQTELEGSRSTQPQAPPQTESEICFCSRCSKDSCALGCTKRCCGAGVLSP